MDRARMVCTASRVPHGLVGIPGPLDSSHSRTRDPLFHGDLGTICNLADVPLRETVRRTLRNGPRRTNAWEFVTAPDPAFSWRGR